MRFIKSAKLSSSLVILLSLFAKSSFAKDQDYDKKIMERVMVIGESDNQQMIAGSSNFISQEDLDNYSYKDVGRVLKQVPGVNIQEEDGFGLRPNIGMRGGRSDRSADITLMEDGILIAPAPYSSPSAYYFPRISRMESIEVRKGSSAIEFGPRTTSGAINLISAQTPDKMILDASAAYGSFDNEVLSLRHGNKLGNFSYLVDVNHEKSSGFKKIDVIGNDTGFSIQDFMTKLKYTSDDDAEIYQSIELKLGYTTEDSNETYLGLNDADFWDNPYRRYSATQLDNMTSDHKQYQLRHFIDLNNFDLTSTIYRNEFSRNWYKLHNLSTITSAQNQSGLTLRANNRDYYSQGIQSILVKDFKLGQIDHEVKFSARFHEDEEDRFQRDDQYDLVNGVMNLTDYGIDGAAGDRKIYSKATALYIRDKIKYGKLTITPGLRYENIDQERIDANNPSSNNKNNISTFVPGIGSLYQINDNLSTFASVHKGFAPPTPGSDDQDEEESINYELGFRFNKDSLQSSITGFFNNYSNLLGECTVSSGNENCDPGDQFNGGEVEVKGLEFEARYNALEYFENSKYKLPITFNYTYTDARFQNSFTSNFDEWGSVTSGSYLPYIAKNQFFISLGLEAPKWEFHINGKYLGKMRGVAGSGPIPSDQLINDQFVVDFASEIKIDNKTRFFLNIDNIFDKVYMVSRSPARARPGKPLTILGGVKYSF